MTPSDDALAAKVRKSHRAASRFHLRVGQAGTAAKVYDEYSLPLFPFWMLMDTEGLLASDVYVLSDDPMRVGPTRCATGMGRYSMIRALLEPSDER